MQKIRLVNKFLFKSAVVTEKPQIPGLPSSFKASETLCLIFTDEEYGLELRQFYSAFDDTDVRQIWAQCPSDEGLGLAVANRIKKAAGFSVVEV